MPAAAPVAPVRRRLHWAGARLARGDFDVGGDFTMHGAFVPPFPPRSEKPRGALSTILTLRRNPLEIWGEADFERPFSIGRSILGLRAAAHDPAAVRRVLLDNAANYRKDDLQLQDPQSRASATAC